MPPSKETIRESMRVVRGASHEQIHEFFTPKFRKRLFSPWFSRTLLKTHYALDFMGPLTVCGKYIPGASSHRTFTLGGDCRKCKRRYLKALERFIHEEIFAANPTNPLEGFMEMNEAAERKTENYSQKKLVGFLAKQILIQ